MKSIYKFWIILIFLFATSVNVEAAITYSLDNRCGTAQLVVLVTPNQNYSGGQAVWSPAAFTISYPMSYGPSVLGAISNQNGFAFATAGVLGNDGIYYYQKYAHSAGTSLAMTNGNSYEVTRIALNGPGIGVFCTFEIPASTNPWIGANNGYSIFSNSNGNQVVNPYGVTTLANIPLFAGIFWDGTSWCGGSGTNEQPGASDAALTCYVNGMGATLTTPVATPAVVQKLKITTGSQLTINPGAAMTVNDSTFINSAEGLVIASGSSGTGSFKNFANSSTVNKTIYGTGASAKVQVYMANSETPGTFHMHLLGIPTYNPSLGDPLTPVGAYQYLSTFELQDGGTYSYKYDEVTNTWVNIWQPTDLVPRLGGVALSDVSGVSKVLSFTGKLNSGNVNQPVLAGWARSKTPAGGNGLFLFSNPYACGLKLSQFYQDNAAYLAASFWTWENPNDNYGTWFYDEEEIFDWIGTLGIASANGVVSPGQGFFGQYGTLGNVKTMSIYNGSDLERVHTYTPVLKSIPINFLRITAEGNYSKDEIIVRFTPHSTPGFDLKRDIENWPSMSDDATEINTYAGDISLTVNSLPSLIPGQMTSVPMYFKCGAETSYTIKAINMESFEEGTEIWLEDNGQWYSLNENPEYTFNCVPGEYTNRFILHFMGPTGLDDLTKDDGNVKIYSWQQDAYIMNRGSETMDEYIAYDMMGRELHRGTLSNSTINKVKIDDVTGYYIIKVITKEGGVYTGKVYITK